MNHSVHHEALELAKCGLELLTAGTAIGIILTDHLLSYIFPTWIHGKFGWTRFFLEFFP